MLLATVNKYIIDMVDRLLGTKSRAFDLKSIRRRKIAFIDLITVYDVKEMLNGKS